MDTIRLLGIVVVLAGVDLAGGVLLKEASLRRSPELALSGFIAFVVLAGILYFALETTSLTLVTLGWIVLLQAAVMFVDHRWYDTTPGRVQLVAIVVAMLALVVACAAPSSESTRTTATSRIPLQRIGTMTLDEYLRDRPDADESFFDVR